MNLNELIKKYEEKYSRQITNHPVERLTEEILQDLNQLKEKQINGLNNFYQVIRIKPIEETFSVSIEFIKQTNKEIIGE